MFHRTENTTCKQCYANEVIFTFYKKLGSPQFMQFPVFPSAFSSGFQHAWGGVHYLIFMETQMDTSGFPWQTKTHTHKLNSVVFIELDKGLVLKEKNGRSYPAIVIHCLCQEIPKSNLISSLRKLPPCQATYLSSFSCLSSCWHITINDWLAALNRPELLNCCQHFNCIFFFSK